MASPPSKKQHTALCDNGAGRVSPLAVPLMMANAAAGVVAMHHGLQGQSFGCSSACASGAHAIGLASRLVASGDADIVVAGGTESALTPLATAAFARMDATSTAGISRPFDRRRDGFVMGEGAASLVLESEEHAKQRGAEVLGWLVGYAATSDAFHLTAPHPSGEGASRAIELALKDAGAKPSEVAYVNAHGTSTPLNDRAETEAIKTALGDRAGDVQISSLKSAIGHTLGAAGAIEAVATLQVLREKVVPPTLGLEEADEGLDLDYVPLEAQPLANGNGARIGNLQLVGLRGPQRRAMRGGPMSIAERLAGVQRCTMPEVEVPAVWTVNPGADREKVEDVVGRLAERLGTPSPKLTDEFVLLPADYPRVARALDEVEPGWRDEALLIPPVA